LATLALRLTELLTPKVAGGGVTNVTVMFAAAMEMLAFTLAAGSAVDAAVTVTVLPEGMVAGAV
jgi:hypothetical protein